MKKLFFVFCLLSIIYFFSSCSSLSDKGKNDGRDSTGTSMTGDTALHGLTGVIEANPPVVDGNYATKYASGMIKMKGFYIRGKREGEWICFFETGGKQSEGFFKNGLRDGKALVYYENGQVYYEGFYKDGREVGKWVFYDKDGKKINEKDYDKPNS